MGKNIFVTGAAGFIGFNLVRELLARGNRVLALVRKKPLYYLSCDSLKTIEGNILEKGFLTKALKEIDMLFHCAASISFSAHDFNRSYEINVAGTENVLEAALYNRVKKVVHLSSASVLGYTKSPKEMISEDREFNLSKKNSYTYTKKLAEKVVAEYVRKGLDVSIANISTVYGREDRKMNSGSIIKSIYRNQVKFVPPGGTSYVSINDLVEGLLNLSEKGRQGERYIFSAENVTFFELFNRIANTLRRRPIKLVMPRWTFLPVCGIFSLKDFFLKNSCRRVLPLRSKSPEVTIPDRHQGTSSGVNLLTKEIIKESYFYKYYSPKKAKDELGWQPKVFLEEAVVEALDFYLKEGLI